MAGNIRLYNTSGYVELQAPSSASAQVLELPTDSIKPGLVHLHTETFSAQSTVSIDDVFSATYQNYRVIIVASSNQAGTIFNLRLRASGSDTTTNYQGSMVRFEPSSTSYDPQVTDRLKIGVVRNTYANAMDLFISEAALATSTSLTGTHQDVDQAGVTGGVQTGATAFDGFTLYADTGTITGTIRVYGYRNS